MVQEVINVGAFANDGTGDPLRTALVKTNNNFSRLFSTVGSVDTYTTNTPGANLILAPTFNANVLIGPNSALVANSTWFTSMTANNATFYGQIVTNTVYPIIGNLSGTASSATVATTALYATTAGTAIAAQNFTGNNLPNVNTIGNLISANIAIANIGTLNSNSNLYVTGNIVAGPASYVLGNGYYLSGLSVGGATYGNSNVAAYLSIYNGNIISSNTYGYINGIIGANIANTATFTNLTTGNATVTSNLSAGNISITYNETIGGNVTVTGNITANNITVGNTISLGNSLLFSSAIVNAAGSNQGTATSVTADNIFVTGGSGGVILPIAVQGREISITNNTASTINVYPATGHAIENLSANTPITVPAYATVGLIAKSGNNWWTSQPIYTAGTGVTINQSANGGVTWSIGQPVATTNSVTFANINGGNVIVSANVNSGNITASANVTGLYYYGNGSTLSGLYGNTQTSAYIGSYLPTYSGNLTAGNLVATGNVGGTYFIGNGSLLTGLYSNATTAAYLPTYSGNINAGNVNTTSNVYATYFVGSSQYLTGLYGNTQVAAYLPQYYSANAISANGVASNSYILSYITINGYTFANLANSASNTVTLYGNVSTLILDYTAGATAAIANVYRSEEHTSQLQSH